MRTVINVIISLFPIWMSSFCRAHMSRDMRLILRLHNIFRREMARELQVANMNRLVWSNSLAEDAEREVRCDYDSPVMSQLGTNTLVGRIEPGVTKVSPIETLLQNYYSQRQFFYRTDRFEGCIPWYGCLEFRRMMNAKHRLIGCAIQRSCGNYSVLFCRYQGGSANENNLDFMHGPPCTKCHNKSSPFCLNDLCVRCDSSRRPCDCRKTCWKDGVGQGQLNNTTCTCDCQYGLGPNCDEPCRNPSNLGATDVCQLLATAGNDPDQVGDVEPLNCQEFAQQCPVQCEGCTPWPGTSTTTKDDPIDDDGVYVDEDFERNFNISDYDNVVFVNIVP